MSAGSVAKRQIRFLWRLEPVERWPALPVPRFCTFRGMGHQVESVSDVEAFDPGPLVVLKAAKEDGDHTLRLFSTSVHHGAAVHGQPLLP